MLKKTLTAVAFIIAGGVASAATLDSFDVTITETLAGPSGGPCCGNDLALVSGPELISNQDRFTFDMISGNAFSITFNSVNASSLQFRSDV